MANSSHLFAVLDSETEELITEGDISNNGSGVPWLKDVDGKWKLAHYCEENPTCKVVRVDAKLTILS